MEYLVFAQIEGIRIPLATLLANARAHSQVSVDVREESLASGETVLDVSAYGAAGTYRIRSRGTEASDVAQARVAERRGRAAGMSELAARCASVWTVMVDEATPEWLAWELCALLALTGLGPILPPGGETLLGVRSARERAERLRGPGH